MTVVGSAYVEIRALPDTFKKDLEAMLSRLSTQFDKAGGDLGNTFSKSFSKSLSDNLLPEISAAADLIREEIGGALDDIGKRSVGGDGFTAFNDSIVETHRNLEDVLDGLDAVGSLLDETNGKGLNLGGGSGSNVPALVAETGLLADELDKVAQAGANAGDGMRDGNDGAGLFGSAMNWLRDGASQAGKALDGLILSGNLLGPAIAGAVGAVSSLVSGLFAIVAAAGQAAPALTALIPAAFGLAQIGAVLGIGFKGVFEAVGAGFKSVGAAAAGSAGKVTKSASAIAAARAALRDALERQSDGAADAAKRVAKAERDVSKAQNEARKATLELADARAKAYERLQQLQFAAEGAVLSEQEATLKLQDAFKALEATKNLPADSRARIDAELAFKQADLAMRKARDNSNDLAKENATASKLGVEGSQEVIDAKDKIAKANENVLQQERDLNDARVAQSRQARDAAQAVADAQRRLNEALAGTKTGATKAAAAANAYQTALDKLAPSQQAFVKQLIAMKPIFKSIQTAIADGLFPPITAALKVLVSSGFFKVLQKGLGDTAAVVGKFIGDLLRLFATPFFKKALGDIMASNVAILKKLAPVGLALAEVLVTVADAAGPVLTMFADWVSKSVLAWSETKKGEKNVGRLSRSFSNAAGILKTFGSVFGKIFDLLGGLGKAAGPTGVALLESLSTALSGLIVEVDKGTKNGGLQSYFAGVGENVKAISGLIGGFVRVFASFGDNKGIADGANALKPLIPIVKEIGDRLIDSGPALSKLAVAVGKVVLAFTQSGAIETFLNVFTKVAEAIAWVANTGIGGWVIGIGSVVFGFTRALRILGRVSSFFAKATLGNLLNETGKLLGLLKKIPVIGPLIAKSFGFLSGLLGKIPILGKLLGGKGGNQDKKDTKAAKDGDLNQTNKLLKDILDEIRDCCKETQKSLRGIKIPGAAGATRNGPAALPQSNLPNPRAAYDDFDKNVKKAGRSLPGLSGAADGVKSKFRGFGDSIDKIKGKTGGLFGKLKGRLGDDRSGGRDRGSAKIGGLGKIAGAAGGLLAILPLLSNPKALDGIIKSITDIASALPTIITKIATAIPGLITSIASAIGPVISSIAAAFPKVINSLAAAIPQIIGAIAGALPQVIQAIATALPVVIKAIAGALPLIIGAVVKALPIIIKALTDALPLVIGALADALPLIIKGLVTAIPQIIVAVVQAIPLIVSAVVQSLPLIIQGLISAIPELIKGIIAAIPQIISGVVSAVPQLISAVLNIVPTLLTSLPLGDVASDAVTKVKDVFLGFVKWYFGLPGRLLKAGGKAFAWLWDKARDIVKKVVSVYVGLIKWYVSLPGKLLAAGGAAFAWLFEKAKDIYKKVTDKIGEVITWFKGLPAKLRDGAGDLFAWFRTKAKDVRDWVVNKIAEVVTWVKDLPAKIRNAAGDLFAVLREKAGAVKTAVTNKIGEIITWVGDLPTKIRNKAGDIFGVVRDKARDAKDWAATKLGELVTTVTGLPKRISTAASGMFDGIKTAFRGAINWIIRSWNNLEFGFEGFRFNIPKTNFGIDVPGLKFKTPNIPEFAKGADSVAARKGGTLALIAEAGRAERITPLDARGYSKGDRAVLAAIAAMAKAFKEAASEGGGSEVRVFIGETELTNLVTQVVDGKNTKSGRNLNYAKKGTGTR